MGKATSNLKEYVVDLRSSSLRENKKTKPGKYMEIIC